ncbi:MAG: TetR/AcrR family transcriptional regulator [Caulobacteraceae bacterium]|nr:TetR/AcrR family transcriptional regulator [Caulobacteraceae bacterium]
MRYDEEHKQRTREKVLEAAARTIRAEGPDRVGVAAVMAEAGLTHGGFYAHFASKDELVAEAIKAMFVDASRLYRDATEGKPAAKGLRDYVKSYVSRRHRDGRAAGCPLAALATDLPRLPEPARLAFGEGVQRLTDRLAGLLGDIGWPDAPAAASALLSEMVGAVSLARSVADPAQSDRILLASRTAILRRLGLDADA